MPAPLIMASPYETLFVPLAPILRESLTQDGQVDVEVAGARPAKDGIIEEDVVPRSRWDLPCFKDDSLG